MQHLQTARVLSDDISGLGLAFAIHLVYNELCGGWAERLKYERAGQFGESGPVMDNVDPFFFDYSRLGEPSMKGRRAFTLIELLVVIAIIALLMAILMPALSRAKKQARTVTCRALLKQWGPMWYMYCNDNNSFFSNGNIGGVDWRRGEWVIVLRSAYETKSEILRCPVAVKRLPGKEAHGGPYNTYVMGSGGTRNLEEEASFGQNNWLYNPPAGVTAIQGRPAAQHWRNMNVRGAAEIPVFADTMWRGGGPSVSGEPRGAPPRFNGEWTGADAEMRHFCIDRHNGLINHLFLDWSVRAVGVKELWTLRWHKQFDMRGPWTKAGGVQSSDWPEWMRRFKEY